METGREMKGRGEFGLIGRFFASLGASREDVVLGVGDDAALLDPAPGHQLALAVDTLVEGVHFPASTDPFDIGHKALAVNLSDMAAMGADPAWATLALTMPRHDAEWLARFSEGFGTLARRFGVALVGGDTTRGPLTITVQVGGLVAPGRAMRRDGARPGDLVCITGTLGDAGLGLRLALGEATLGEGAEYFLDRLNRPTPRVEAGRALATIATAAIDLSDGLAADLGHLLEAGGVGATLDAARLPVAPEVKRLARERPWWRWPLTAGDDYELCFTVSPSRRGAMERALATCGCPVTIIGTIGAEPGLRITEGSTTVSFEERGGYDHFE